MYFLLIHNSWRNVKINKTLDSRGVLWAYNKQQGCKQSSSYLNTWRNYKISKCKYLVPKYWVLNRALRYSNTCTCSHPYKALQTMVVLQQTLPGNLTPWILLTAGDSSCNSVFLWSLRRTAGMAAVDWSATTQKKYALFFNIKKKHLNKYIILNN